MAVEKRREPLLAGEFFQPPQKWGEETCSKTWHDETLSKKLLHGTMYMDFVHSRMWIVDAKFCIFCIKILFSE